MDAHLEAALDFLSYKEVFPREKRPIIGFIPQLDGSGILFAALDVVSHVFKISMSILTLRKESMK